LALGALAASCAPALISDPVTRTGDGWTFVLERFSDGPNEIRPMGYTVYEAERGQRLLHAWLRFRNDAAAPRVFGYDACDLDLDDRPVLPGLVVRYNGVASVMEKNERFAAGEENARHLVFSYPEGRLPARLQCATVSFPIPRAAPNAAAR
jgi:hypothetical protein